MLYHDSKRFTLFLMSYRSTKDEAPHPLIVRLLIDGGVLDFPMIDHDLKITNMDKYFDFLPSRGIMYAMKHGYLVSMNSKMLKQAHPFLFSANPLYSVLSKRYYTWQQPLIEYQETTKDSKKLIEQLQIKVCGRVTAYSYELIKAMLLCSSFELYTKGAVSRSSNIRF